MRKFIVLLLISLSLQLPAQVKQEKIKVGVLSGYAFYGQKDLNSVNQNIIDQLPFEVGTIDDFEPVFYFGAYTQYRLFDHFYLGPAYEYHYTGSRLGARDYSGMFSFDQYVKTHQIGLKADYSLIRLTRAVFNVELNAGASFTDWRMESDLEIGDNGELSDKQLDELKGLSWYVSPAFKIEYRIIPKVSLVGGVDYSFDLIKKYHYKENKDYEIVKTPDWSGLKLSLGLAFDLE